MYHCKTKGGANNLIKHSIPSYFVAIEIHNNPTAHTSMKLRESYIGIDHKLGHFLL